MKKEFRKDIKNCYLVIESDIESIRPCDYRLKMITENKIERLAPCSTQMMNGTELLYYNVSEKMQLSEYLKSYQADEMFFRGLFFSLSAALRGLNEFLLENDGLLLMPEDIFVSVEDKELQFIYYPYNTDSYAEGCRMLSEMLLRHIKQDDIVAVRLGYGFYKSCVTGRISAEALNEILNEGEAVSDKEGRAEKNEALRKEQAFEEKKKAVKDNEDDYSFLFSEGSANEVKETRGRFFGRLFKAREKGRKNKSEKKEEINTARVKVNYETETDIFSDIKADEDMRISASDDSLPYLPYKMDEKEYQETVLLDEESRKERRRWLMPKNDKAGSRILLDKDEHLIGKKIAGADIHLESKAVSRIHAKLIREGDEYFLIDLGSKNATALNGSRLNAGQSYVLKDGDEINFANSLWIYENK